jgi:hypothetical protein
MSSYDELPEGLAARLDPVDVRSYARATGWSPLPGVNGKLAIYGHPSSDLDQLIVPLERELDDYGRRMSEVVARLAAKEDRPASLVLKALLLPRADVLRFHVSGSDAQRGDLPFAEGVDILLGVRKVVRAAACSAIKPRAFHPRMSRLEADQLIQACRLGQTEGGSFTLVVACPVDAVESPGPGPDRTPFTRKVTSLLMRSVARIAAAVDEGTADALLLSPDAEPGLSANLCDGLVDMQPRGDDGGLSLAVEWARALPQADAALAALTHGVRLRREHFSFAAELLQRLRPKAAMEEPQLFVGHVDELRGVPGGDGRVQGEVVLSVLLEDEALRARADLDAAAYAEALEAHRSTRLVSLKGLLRRGIKVHRMDAVTGFRRMED